MRQPPARRASRCRPAGYRLWAGIGRRLSARSEAPPWRRRRHANKLTGARRRTFAVRTVGRRRCRVGIPPRRYRSGIPPAVDLQRRGPSVPEPKQPIPRCEVQQVIAPPRDLVRGPRLSRRREAAWHERRPHRNHCHQARLIDYCEDEAPAVELERDLTLPGFHLLAAREEERVDAAQRRSHER